MRHSAFPELFLLVGLAAFAPSGQAAGVSRAAEAGTTVVENAEAAWGRRDLATARRLFSAAATAPGLPADVRAYARLRLAEACASDGDPAAALGEYRGLAAEAAAPDPLRDLARHGILAMQRRNPALATDPAPPRRRPAARAPHPGRVFFVSPEGSDSAEGTDRHPFASLERARDAIRSFVAAQGLPPGGITVRLKPGTYRISEPLRLSAADGGTADRPVTYRAEIPGQAVLCGGTRITGFARVTDPAVLRRLPPEARGKVWQSDLRAQGITDYGVLRIRGFQQQATLPTLEVYVDGAPGRPARWPNSGFAHANRLIDSGSKRAGRPTVLGLDTPRLARWIEAPDAWLFGYFRFGWADSTLPIARVDPQAGTLTTAEPYDYPSMEGADDRHGIRFYVFNLLEEVDEPGEWYLDRTRGILYLYAPVDPNRAVVEVSLLTLPMVEARGVSHLRLEGLVFDLGCADGIDLRDAEACVIAGCTIRRMAGTGLRILGGHGDLVQGCELHTLGRRGAEIVGGDRATLTPGRHLVESCRIHDFGRIDRTYTPGVELDGVGNRIAHNLIYDCPSSAVHIEGNDHVIEFNDIRNAVLESDDQGAMELFGNPTYRGVIFRFNSFRGVGPQGEPSSDVAGRAGLRFDDVISGMLVYGNVFWRAAYGGLGAIQVNSGRDNLIVCNLFLDCQECVTGGWEESNSMWQLLREGRPPSEFLLTDLYLRRYPGLGNLLGQPAMNEAWGNVAYRCSGAWTGTGSSTVVPPARARPDRWRLFANRTLPDDLPGPGAEPEAGAPLRFDPAFLERAGFGAFPFGEIGPCPDYGLPAAP